MGVLWLVVIFLLVLLIDVVGTDGSVSQFQDLLLLQPGKLVPDTEISRNKV